MEEYTVYGYSACQYCKKALAALQSAGKAYRYVQIEEEANRKAFMDRAGYTGTQRTWPRVFLGSELVGGYSELEDKLLGF